MGNCFSSRQTASPNSTTLYAGHEPSSSRAASQNSLYQTQPIAPSRSFAQTQVRQSPSRDATSSSGIRLRIPGAGGITTTQTASTAGNNALRVPKPWRSNSRQWTRSQLDGERTAFFDTRVTGRQEIWAAVQMAVEAIREHADLATAAGVLEAAGASCPTGKLTDGVWDERGVLYKVPKWVCSDPVNVVNDQDQVKEGSGDNMDVEDDDDDDINVADVTVDKDRRVRLRARLSDRGEDVLVDIDRAWSVRLALRKVHEAAKMAPETNVKFAYLGKILKPNETLIAQGWREGHTINALVFA